LKKVNPRFKSEEKFKEKLRNKNMKSLMETLKENNTTYTPVNGS